MVGGERRFSGGLAAREDGGAEITGADLTCPRRATLRSIGSAEARKTAPRPDLMTLFKHLSQT
jgi:hypothetical protein